MCTEVSPPPPLVVVNIRRQRASAVSPCVHVLRSRRARRTSRYAAKAKPAIMRLGTA
ncbi:hypothetical protein [Streptomyces sp. Ru62]|uniref:hypothetical protein n=1 Tax=Streptomyces sp. Ru62 TaxID=2080745 RepID=UPI0015E43302